MEKNITTKLERIFLEKRKPFFWITIFGLILFTQNLFFKFYNFDDNLLIVNNINFLRNPANIFKIFTLEIFTTVRALGYYRPILILSLMIDSWVMGADPFFFHFTNIVIHLATSIFVYLLFILKIRKEISFVLALVFVVHPVLATTVSWIPARNDSLLALFVVISLISYINFTNKPSKKNLSLHLLFFALAIFTKEPGVLIPPIFFSYTLIRKKFNKIKSKYLVLFSSWFVITAAWYYFRHIALKYSPQISPFSMFQSIHKDLAAYLLYLGKIFFPFNLSTAPILESSNLVFGYLALSIIFVLILISKKKSGSKIFLGGLIFFAFLLPGLLRPHPGYSMVFYEHRIYLPMIGILILLSEAFRSRV